MKVARTLPELHEARRALLAGHGGVALVPTMGALHDGHLTLVREAVRTGHATVASIFVNPTQFGAHEDFGRYPRTEEEDLAGLEAAGCALAWLPDVSVMYPANDATLVEVGGPSRFWENIQRPGHFRGVATVCAKLFSQTRADFAFFGEKDWQQLQVIRRMVQDLHLHVRIVGVPTVRDTDGLALSSRNRFLSGEERERAPLLHGALTRLAARLAAGSAAAGLLDQASAELTGKGLPPDYLALVDGTSLEPIASARSGCRLIAAVRIGSVRLLDNVAVG
ncbi:MAG: pantoate--beta-alanine ligase [Acetobacteraceae bacterium]|nr:pantoate--beta-alanine ligase [Acetobacteraceae bacterium]